MPTRENRVTGNSRPRSRLTLGILVAGFALLAAEPAAADRCADGGSPLPPWSRQIAPGQDEGGIGGTGIGDAGGISGTGRSEDRGGIGGTGVSAPQTTREESGVGGTGIDLADSAQGGLGGTGIDGGLGGTGIEGGVSGTGVVADGGLGGTGIDGGLGGTGIEGGISGTGAVARADDGGIGGTGIEGGVGGTGIDSGIGGTGILAQGDRGILGTITGFASICVGGTEIHFDPTTPVDRDGQRVSISELAVGQVVEVVAVGSGAEVEARQIRVHHALRGPISFVDHIRDELEVLGQSVRIAEGTRTVSGGLETLASASDFAPGQIVEVSGLRRADDSIAASRIRMLPQSDTVQLVGPVTELGPDVLVIAGTVVEVDSLPSDLSLGREVVVVGNWDGAQVDATRLTANPLLPFGGQLERVEIEGFSSGPVERNRMRVGGYEIAVPDAFLIEFASVRRDQRLRVDAVVEGQRLVAQRFTIVRELPALLHRPRVRLGAAAATGGGAAATSSTGVPPGSQRPESGTAPPPHGKGPHKKGVEARGRQHSGPRTGAPRGVAAQPPSVNVPRPPKRGAPRVPRPPSIPRSARPPRHPEVPRRPPPPPRPPHPPPPPPRPPR